MSLSAENAMKQAAATAWEYFDMAANAVNEGFPKASEDSKVIAASNLAIAAALDYLAAELGGRIDGGEGLTKCKAQCPSEWD